MRNHKKLNIRKPTLIMTYTIKLGVKSSCLRDEMIFKMLHHSKRSESFDSEYFEQIVIANGKLLVFRILKNENLISKLDFFSSQNIK